MPAPLSIVIPTLNVASALPATAASLIEGLDSGLVRELVISDGGSKDSTRDVADELGATVVLGDPGRGGQLARGALAATGEWLLFLHADTQLSPGWAEVALQHIQTSQKAGFFRLRFRATGFRPRFFEAGANMRSQLGLPYGDQGLLISRALYEKVGGYKDMPLMEDVAIARALSSNLVMLGAQALTSAARYQKGGWYRRGIRNMWTLARYRFGADPARLARYYEG